MYRILSLLLFLPLLSMSSASELELKTAYLPIYVAHGVVNEGAEMVHAKPRMVSFVSRGAEPESTLTFLKTAFIPSHDTTWHEAGDANLISLCGIKLSHAYKELDEGVTKFEIMINTSSLKIPDNVTLSKELVMDLIRQAVALNFPYAVITIINGEKAGTEQPATQAELNSEGSDKPQPE